MKIEEYSPKKTPVIIIKDNKDNVIYLKDETKQYTEAFKYRGVYNKFIKNNMTQYEAIITASTGNHGQAVSLCSKIFGKICYIVLPFNTPIIKRKKILKNGANIIINKELKNYQQCEEYAKNLAKAKKYCYIPSFDDYDIIEGHKTMFQELNEYGQYDYCFCPVGGGGLISAALTSKELENTKVYGVEIEKNDAMKQSIQNKERKEIILEKCSAASFCEGILVNRVGEIPFEIAINGNLEIETVTLEEVKQAIKELYKLGIIAEGAGAASFAAIKKQNIKNKRILCIISGGNINQDIFEKIIGEIK